jgi:hypothetical protein
MNSDVETFGGDVKGKERKGKERKGKKTFFIPPPSSFSFIHFKWFRQLQHLEEVYKEATAKLG